MSPRLGLFGGLGQSAFGSAFANGQVARAQAFDSLSILGSFREPAEPSPKTLRAELQAETDEWLKDAY